MNVWGTGGLVDVQNLLKEAKDIARTSSLSFWMWFQGGRVLGWGGSFEPLLWLFMTHILPWAKGSHLGWQLGMIFIRTRFLQGGSFTWNHPALAGELTGAKIHKAWLFQTHACQNFLINTTGLLFFINKSTLLNASDSDERNCRSIEYGRGGGGGRISGSWRTADYKFCFSFVNLEN